MGLLLMAAPARAGKPPVADLPTLGLDAARKGREEQAIALWARWLNEVDAPPPRVEGPVRKNLGTLLERRGALAGAWYQWSVAALLRPSDQELHRWKQELETRLRAQGRCTVLIVFPRRPNLLTVDGERVPGPRERVSWWLSPGPHRIEAVLGGRRVVRKESVSCKSPEPTIEVAGESQAGNAWPYVLAGSGAALAALGGMTYWVAVREAAALDDEFRPRSIVPDPASAKALQAQYDERWSRDVVPWNAASWVLWGVGGAAVVGGVVWWFLQAEPDGGSGSAWVPVVWPTGDGVVVGIPW